MRDNIIIEKNENGRHHTVPWLPKLLAYIQVDVMPSKIPEIILSIDNENDFKNHIPKGFRYI